MADKLLRVIVHHHMDMIWRRCFSRDDRDVTGVISSYGTIEEAQVAQALELCETSDARLDIEQGLTVKKYLEKNPDDTERIRRLVKAGKLDLLGCGMVAMDTNLSTGEALLRNQVYGVQYQTETFGYRSRYANCCDLFGLSGQLPQILKLTGYLGIGQFSRFFPEHKPLCRGIDGSVIVFGNSETSSTRVGFGRYCDPCPVCGGEGCAACDFLGIDTSYRNDPSDYRQSLRNVLTENKEKSGDVLDIMVQSEEGLLDSDFAEATRQVAAECGYRVQFLTHDAFHELHLGAAANMLAGGTYTEDDIQPEREANPVATGCYTSRIRLKQKLRETEQMLLSAEKLAALCPAPDYPEKKLHRLWDMLFLAEFHDCVTGSHSDAAYNELFDSCREICRGAEQIARRAAAAVLANRRIPGGNGLSPFVLFNMADVPTDGQPLTYTFHTLQKTMPEVLDAAGHVLPLAGLSFVPESNGFACTVTFFGRIAAHGFAPFAIRMQESPALAEGEEAPPVALPGGVLPEARIENEYYIITPDGITDRKTGRRVCGCGEFRLSNDKGDPWGRKDAEHYNLTMPYAGARAETSGAASVLHLTGGYALPGYEPGTTEWASYTLHITLYAGCDTVYYTADADWSALHKHLYAVIPLSFAADHALYEIPFGMLERAAGNGEKGYLGRNDEWPAQNWFAAEDPADGVAVILLNRGLHGCRLKDNTMQISLMRSTGYDKTLYNRGCREAGAHTFFFALTLAHGGAVSADPTGRGTLYTTPCLAVPAAAAASALPGEGTLLSHQADGAHIPAVFRLRDGKVAARVYDAYGSGSRGRVTGMTGRCDVFGEDRTSADSLCLKPFEIATVLL